MPTPILATKLYIPLPRAKIVLRPSLIERLNEGLAAGRKLTLISAPAGFGKTTLVSEWVEDCRLKIADTCTAPTAVRRECLRLKTNGSSQFGNHQSEIHNLQFCWLSLDEGDNDPARFLMYLVSALQTIAANIGEGVLAMLHASQPQPPPIESILTTLLNEITTFPDNFVLVLDDYHIIDSKPVDQALTFLVEHLPPQMHLVIATREDPHLPLARLRARGQLTELRAADMRFTLSEAAEFLNRVMGLNLSADDIAALETRTEGWITGLQLAALSMQSRQDTTSFIHSFAGSHRYVLDYLVEEILQRQLERVRSFLLQTSILERLCGPLCNAVTGQEDGNAILETLERGNLFIIPLDDQRQWYRYHHLFAEVLQTYLRDELPDSVSKYHQRASLWFEQNDLQAEAIRHSLSAKDYERAADLIECIWRVMDLNYQYETWLVWAKALPEELIRARPVLSVGYAWAMLGVGELEASEARLLDAEQWLKPASEQTENLALKMAVADEAEFRSLPASISAARAYRALALGDIPGTKLYARQTLALVSDGESIHHTQATALLGMAEYASGDLQAAENELLKFQEMMWQVNDLASAIGISFILANIKLVQGHLHEAVNTYRKSIQLAESRGASSFLGASELHRGLSELLCEQDDMDSATQYLLSARQLGEQSATTGWPQRLCVAQARIKEAQGDLEGALVLLDEAEHQKVRNPLPDRPIAALKARTWARQGQLSKATSWVREQGLSPDDTLGYMREFDHLTLARVLIAEYQSDRVVDGLKAGLALLARLLKAAEDGGRNGSVIEILVLQALALQTQGDQPLALASLERALKLAEPEGYVRVFADEGEAMRLLIADFRPAPAVGQVLWIEKQKLEQDQKLIAYTDKLLAAFRQPVAATPKSKIVNLKSEIVEPLSTRELEVLKLLCSELSGPEIAQQLIVSINTLRTHTKNIFNKLGVNDRRAAIRRAEELDLF